MNTYVITIWANPGIYGEDDQGNPWTTFQVFNRTIACDECGAEIDRGYERGKWGEKQLHVCCKHVSSEVSP